MYGQAGYEEVAADLKKRLRKLRVEFKDTDEVTQENLERYLEENEKYINRAVEHYKMPLQNKAE